MKNKSKSYTNFKIRELSSSEKSLLNKYSQENKKSIQDINPGKKGFNLKLNLYGKKIVKLRNENKDNLRIKHSANNDNFYNSLFINKKNKEYYRNLYNDENTNLTNIITNNNNNNNNNNSLYSNNSKDILSKTKNIFFNNPKNPSYKSMYDIYNNSEIPNLKANLKKFINNPKYISRLNDDSINNKYYSLTIGNNNSINPYKYKSEKNDHIARIIPKKMEQKQIKNKIISKAVDVLRKKREDNKSHVMKNINNFKVNHNYNTFKIRQNKNKDNKSFFKFSSIRMELINKNKK